MQGLQHQLFQSTEPILLHQISHQSGNSHDWQLITGILQRTQCRQGTLTKTGKVIFLFTYLYAVI